MHKTLARVPIANTVATWPLHKADHVVHVSKKSGFILACFLKE